MPSGVPFPLKSLAPHRLKRNYDRVKSVPTEMVSFFPALYPEELVYSAIARYHIRSGNLSFKVTSRELFNSSNLAATVDLPCGLNALVRNLPKHSQISVESLIKEHTLYPFYAPFLPDGRAKQIERSMKGDLGGDIHNRAGIMASTIATPKYLRFCQQCSCQDLDLYGESYWHRLHQTPGVWFCPIHRAPFGSSDIPISGASHHDYRGTGELTETIPDRLDVNRATRDKLLTLAEDIAYLQQQNFNPQGFDWLSRRYRNLLIDNGYANANGRIRHQKLINDFVWFYGREFLEMMDSLPVYHNPSNWLSQIGRKHRKAFHPIRHLLAIRFLTGSVDSFFKAAKTYAPFGLGPWLCLNRAAPHYLQPVVTDLKVSHCLENKQPLGTFKCQCGTIYARTGPDLTPEHKLRIGKIVAYGSVWEGKLRELVEVERLGLRATARALGVDPRTVRRYAAKLGLVPVGWKGDGERQVETPSTSPDDSDRYRHLWLKARQDNPKLSKTQLRKLIPGAYIWLYRQDREWLVQNSPTPRTASAAILVPRGEANARVDWQQRDKEVLELVGAAVSELLQRKKPVRITLSRVGQTIALQALLEKHLDKLPETQSYLASAMETVADYQIRRIAWAVGRLNEEGEEVKMWKILRIAGLRH